jgi:hypothetical protein
MGGAVMGFNWSSDIQVGKRGSGVFVVKSGDGYVIDGDTLEIATGILEVGCFTRLQANKVAAHLMFDGVEAEVVSLQDYVKGLRQEG